MYLRKMMGIIAIVMTICAAALAAVPEPDWNLSWAIRAYSGPETSVIFNTPGGTGAPFTHTVILIPPGIRQIVDSTITLTVVESTGDPIPFYPATDIWLESTDGGLSICPGPNSPIGPPSGTIPDHNTDINGRTTWIAPLRAGGSSQAITRVMIMGRPLTSPGLAIHHNSPDINGDDNVNLSDVGFFAMDYFSSTYEFRSDFHYDGVVNLSDVTEIAQSVGSACP